MQVSGTTDGVIRRKLMAARAEPQDGGPGADRGWRIALARAARDHLKLPLEVLELTLSRAGLAELLELPPERALLVVLEGPGEGLGVLSIAPEVLHAMGEALTVGKLSASAPVSRRPTRTDAAMIAPMLDAALIDLEASLMQEADLIWAGGWRYSSFIEDPRPLGLLLEDIPYRVLQAEVDLGLGQRKGSILLALPAEGKAEAPNRSSRPVKDQAQSQKLFSAALAEEIEAAEARLEAVLARVSLPLSRVASLAVGDIVAMANASLDRVSLEGLDGRKLVEGKLGQNRGMRALRLTEVADLGKTGLRATAQPAGSFVRQPSPDPQLSEPLRHAG